MAIREPELVQELSRDPPKAQTDRMAGRAKVYSGVLLENPNLTALCGFRRSGLMERAFRVFANIARLFYFSGGGEEALFKGKTALLWLEDVSSPPWTSGEARGFLLRNRIF